MSPSVTPVLHPTAQAHGVWPIWEPGVPKSATPIDRAMASLAGRQHGVIALLQLVSLGLNPRTVTARVQAGRLHRIHDGVFAVGHSLLTKYGRYMAAVLACGPGAALSHRSAGDLRGMRPDSRGIVDVTAPRRAGRSRQGIAAHTSRILTPADITIVQGIPCTSVARTLLDLAATIDAQGVVKAIERAERQRIFDAGDVYDLLRRAGGHRGAPKLAAVMGRPLDLDNSELERIAAQLIAGDPSIPPPDRNAIIEGYEMDFAWLDQKLNVEVDGGEFHGTAIARRRDTRRDRRLALADWLVVRYSWDDVVNRPDATLRELRAIVETRSAGVTSGTRG
jgi:predicted transcriptional regulator of viral defense system